MPRGLVHVAGSERRVLSHPGSPPSQTILETRIWRGDISIQGSAVWAVPGSPHFYAMHGCGSFPSATDGNPHTQLPRRLAYSGPVAGGFGIAQDPPPQPLRFPGAQGQLKTVTWIRSPPMCQWFFHFCKRSWINSVPHPPSNLYCSHSDFPCPYCWPIGGQR